MGKIAEIIHYPNGGVVFKRGPHKKGFDMLYLIGAKPPHYPVPALTKHDWSRWFTNADQFWYQPSDWRAWVIDQLFM